MNKICAMAPLLAAAVVFPLGAANAEIFTLNEAMGIAYETNPQLDEARAGQRAVDEGVNQAHANWRPSINATASYGYESLQTQGDTLLIPSHPITAGVTLTQNVFRGGRTAAEISKAKALVRAGRAQLTLTEEGVLLDAVTAYMNVVRDEATMELRKNNVAVLQRQLDATQEQFKVGELTRTDVAQSQARLAGAQSDLVTAEGQLAISRSDFEHAVGRPAESLEANPPLPYVPPTEDAAVQIATRQSPAITAARENTKAADYAIDDAAGALLPQLSINGQYQYSSDSLESGFGTGVQHVAAVVGELTVPIYQGGADESAVRQAKDQKAQAEIGIADAERQAIASTHTAWQSLVAARATIASTVKQVDANKVAYEGVRQEQQVGSRTILDVLNAQQELLNAQVALVASQRDEHVATFQVLASLGWLTAKNLKLKVQVYDPADNYDDNATRWFGFGD